MIYFLSDPHGQWEFAGLQQYLNVATERDLLIILGDVGLHFEPTAENREFTERFLSVSKNIAFVDGNHENFDYLSSLPEEEWHGGTVRRLNKNIVQLKRGNVYSIQGKRFFTFGGCKSSAKWKEMGLWYPDEEASSAELALAYGNLHKWNYSVDYVLTHTYEKIRGGEETLSPLQLLTSFIEHRVRFKCWYFGHAHHNIKVDEKHRMIYDELTALV